MATSRHMRLQGRDGGFEIHEDPRTEDADTMQDVYQERQENPSMDPHDMFLDGLVELQGLVEKGQARETVMEQVAEDEEEEEDEYDDSSDEEPQDHTVQGDMHKLEKDFPGIKCQYRLIKRIGEGTFSTVYKAEDLGFDRYENAWKKDEPEQTKWTPPPLKKSVLAGAPILLSRRRKPTFVAIKKIYVTSSPARIMNELELLYDLRGCPCVSPIITAFRNDDQVVAILPYFRHADFRTYFRDMTISDITTYLRCLFTALKHVHQHKIIHRDIKPTNFLYDPDLQHGVLVDFGLAEREGLDSKPCLCHEESETRKYRLKRSEYAKKEGAQSSGYPKSDTRPSRRANRAGTRGFRAPEVLFKCTEQTTSIDIWSVGVILLTILSKRFPFFNSADDVEALVEIATIFGHRRMKTAGFLHGCVFETSIPTIGRDGFTMEKIILWSTCRGEDKPLTEEEGRAVRFLEKCMELDPSKRLTAEEALQHEFLAPTGSDAEADDDMDIMVGDER